MLRTWNLALVLCFLGCTQVYKVNTTPYDFSTKPEAADHMQELGQVSARYCQRVIFIIPSLGHPTRVFDDLVEQAKEKGGTAVTDVRMEPVNSLIVPFYMRQCFELSGNAAKPVEVAPPPPVPAAPPTKRKK